MKNRGFYKGFVIEARVHELPKGLSWNWEFSIEKHDGQGVTDTPVSLDNPLRSRVPKVL